MRKAIFVPFLLAAVALPQEAGASHVCTASYYPVSTSRGSDGYVTAFYTSGPDCTGSWEGARYYCSAGSTSTTCHASIEYPLEGLLALYGALVSAVETQIYAINWNSTCIGGGTTCGGYVQFEP